MRDQVQAARLAELESAVESLQAQGRALEEEVARKAAAEQRQWAAAAAAAARADAAQGRARSLEQEAQDLGRQVASLQVRPCSACRHVLPPPALPPHDRYCNTGWAPPT